MYLSVFCYLIHFVLLLCLDYLAVNRIDIKVPDADITLSAEEREIGGLGIFLIRQIMNLVEYQRIDGKNVLTMGKRLK